MHYTLESITECVSVLFLFVAVPGYAGQNEVCMPSGEAVRTPPMMWARFTSLLGT